MKQTREKRIKCKPGKQCFSCQLPDCNNSCQRNTDEEKEMLKASYNFKNIKNGESYI